MQQPVEKKIQSSSNLSSYVTREAVITCTLGSAPDVLNLPISHGTYIKGKPQINIADSKVGKNITCFGTCSKGGSGDSTSDEDDEGESSGGNVCVPSICSKWSDHHDTTLLIEGEKALIQDATVACVNGGIISIRTNGYS